MCGGQAPDAAAAAAAAAAVVMTPPSGPVGSGSRSLLVLCLCFFHSGVVLLYGGGVFRVSEGIKYGSQKSLFSCLHCVSFHCTVPSFISVSLGFLPLLLLFL